MTVKNLKITTETFYQKNTGLKKVKLESLVGNEVSVELIMNDKPFHKKGTIYQRVHDNGVNYEMLSLQKDNSIVSNYLSTDFLFEKENVLYGHAGVIGIYRKEGPIMSGEKYTQRKEALTKKK